MATIRPERPSDYAAIEQVTRLAFGGDGEARLVAKLREAGGCDPALSLVAVRDDRVVGHILFSPILIEADGDEVRALALAPMAVLPDYQRQGVGSSLVLGGLGACRSGGHTIAVVVGHAQYYPRFGFVRASQYGVRCPFTVPDEAFMIKALVPSGLDNIAGVVRYPAAFDQV